MRTFTTIKRLSGIAAITALAALLGACTAPATSHAPDLQSSGLAPDVLAACSEILDDTTQEHDQGQIILVDDQSASMSADMTNQMPGALLTAISQASFAGGSLTVIAVDGQDVAPRIVVRNASLSIPLGEATLWTEDEAVTMAKCVQQIILDPIKPTASGSDLGRAIALAAEMITPASTLWVVSDFAWTTGQGALNADLVSQSPTEAATASTKALPIDLHGVALHVAGVANTSTALLPAQRSWFRDYATALCEAWNATDCDAITLDPVNPVTSAASLPDDPIPVFPAVITGCTDSTFTYSLPTGALFDGDSFDVKDEAKDQLVPVIQLLEANPNSTVALVGHTYDPGHSVSGLKLSLQRAQGIADALTKAGIQKNRITSIQGVGNQQPTTGNTNPAAERVVDVIVTGVTCTSH